jgi:oligosaccharide repeat unit polymerase
MPWNILYMLDLFAIALFAVSYYRNCYRRGYRIDIWHFNLFLVCVLPNLLMLPFAQSDLNGAILGQDFAAVMSALPTVFEITLLGYFSILIGGSFWRLRFGLGLRKSVIPLLNIPTRCSAMLMSSRRLLVFQSLLCLFLQMLVLATFFSHNGFGFDLRGYTFANPGLRPVALLASNYSITIAAHCLARYVDKKEKILLVCTLVLTFGLVFFGARSNILGIYMGVLVCYLVRLRTRINILRIAIGASLLVVFVLYLGSVRAGLYSLSDFFTAVFFLLFFGNTFSDLRDFAWVYSGWDHVFWAGKTYLAALVAFVPRFASNFRDTWGLGVATATTAGFDPHLHPGLRPGIFGEGFFNFGLLGVVAVGLMLGIVMRRVDIDVKCALASPRPSVMNAYASMAPLAVAGTFTLTSSFSGLYVLGGIFLFSWFCLRLGNLIKPRQLLADAS